MKCRICNSPGCEHGDHCPHCGCQSCGFPGARVEGRGFCVDCGWEIVPGAYKAWKAKQPIVTTDQIMRQLAGLFGASVPPTDEVGKPIYPSGA